MKILAARTQDNYESLFSDIWTQFNSCGYNFSVDVDKDGLPILSAVAKDQSHMPKVEIRTNVEDDIVFFSTNLIFPNLDSDKLDYYDSTHYWLDNWESLGRVVSSLLKIEYGLDELDEMFEEWELD